MARLLLPIIVTGGEARTRNTQTLSVAWVRQSGSNIDTRQDGVQWLARLAFPLLFRLFHSGAGRIFGALVFGATVVLLSRALHLSSKLGWQLDGL